MSSPTSIHPSIHSLNHSYIHRFVYVKMDKCACLHIYSYDERNHLHFRRTWLKICSLSEKRRRYTERLSECEKICKFKCMWDVRNTLRTKRIKEQNKKKYFWSKCIHRFRFVRLIHLKYTQKTTSCWFTLCDEWIVIVIIVVIVVDVGGAEERSIRFRYICVTQCLNKKILDKPWDTQR